MKTMSTRMQIISLEELKNRDKKSPSKTWLRKMKLIG